MAVRSCRVTICDLNGVTHSAEVTASTLYEAVAPGLVAIRGHDWVGAIAEGLSTIHVSVTPVPVRHSVKVQEFNKWLNRKSGTPKETASRQRVRGILGLPANPDR
ncbi:MAG TPA: hypothetical protein VJQ82_00215 [Terriglobales bacterium]|nr:hypothetical protein [Terriglobales bacterium]